MPGAMERSFVASLPANWMTINVQEVRDKARV